MITVKEWMQLVDYKITEGSEWFSNVPNLYSLTSWNGEQDGYSLNIVFDPTDDQRVYLVEVSDYKNNRAYRLKDEKLVSGDPDKDNQAWDEVNFVDLETGEDFIKKAQAIIAGEDYDQRVSIPVDLPDDVTFTLMKQAHELDITFNQHMNNILAAECERVLGKNI